MPNWLEAGIWGLVAGSALVVGATVAWVVRVPQRVVASVMAFGAGVLISALSFDLMDEAEEIGGLGATLAGFVGCNLVLARQGAQHRKRSGGMMPSENENPGSGAAIAIGALLDGIPESVVLGMSLLAGGGVGVSVLAAIVVSNVPEGLSSAAGMKQSGRSARYVFGVWSAIALACGLAGLAGAAVFDDASPEAVAVTTAVAAGAILAMVADTMIPEAFARTHLYSGLIATLGFAVAFAIGRA
jgi:ZIP family zinc transporter